LSRGIRLQLADGSFIQADEIARMSPSTVRRSHEHLQLCLEVARLAIDDDDKQKVYSNLLVIHSDILFLVSSTLLMHRIKYRDTKRLELGVHLPQSVLDGIRNSGLDVTCGVSQNYLRPGFYLWFQLKLLMHLIYRGMTWRRKWNSSQLFRAYVETTEISHRGEAPSAIVFTYPFKTRFRRQLLYWLRSLIERKKFHLMGIPYRFGDRWRVIFNRTDRDKAIVSIETEAHRRHATEIGQWGFQEVFSDSESEAFGWVLNRYLHQQGIKTINRSHGVGVYGPYIWYDRCDFRNELQRKYYEPFAVIGKSTANRTGLRPDSDAISIDPVRNPRPLSLVLLKGNWEAARKHFEAGFERELAAVLQKVSNASGAQFLVKFHPNATWFYKRSFCRKFGASEAGQIPAELLDSTVFINTLSTAGLDLAGSAPVIFARHELQDPRDVFGQQIVTASLGELPGLIESLRDPAVRAGHLKRQLQQEDHPADGLGAFSR
jgi:hypothetical protein